MPQVTHHISEDLLEAYASGALPHAFSVVVASHLSLCVECRAAAEAFDVLGGVALEALPREAGAPETLDHLRSRTLAALDTRPTPAPEPMPHGPFPAAVMAELKGRPPRWRSLGAGIRQVVLSDAPGGVVRLLQIPPGKAVPDHGHNGLEMTLVLSGSFHDQTGEFGPGDVQVVESEIEHTPTAGEGEACICLAATDAPLRFHALLPRMMQRVFRI